MDLKSNDLFEILEQDASIHYYNRLPMHRLLKLILAFNSHQIFCFFLVVHWFFFFKALLPALTISFQYQFVASQIDILNVIPE